MDHAEFAAPCEIVRLISSLVVKDEPAGNRTLYLVALAGVCKRWRHTAIEVASNVPIALDGADNAGLHGPKATLLKFRKSDVSRKRATFLGASKLLKGYTDVTLTGESITDEVLDNISVVNGHNLISIKLLGTSCVTDVGIIRLISSAPHLKQLVIENAGPGVVGNFVPATLQSCMQLETLHIEGAEGVDWSELHLSGAWLRALQQPAQQPLTGQDPQLFQAATEAGRPLQTAAVIGSTSSDGTVQLSDHHQRRHHRHSSDVSEGTSDIESDDDSTVSAASDATSISVPAAATAALAAQLMHTSLQAGSGGGSADTSSGRQSLSHVHVQQQQLMDSAAGHVSHPQQQQQMLQQGVQCHYALRKLHVRFANVDNLAQLIERCPSLTELHLDGPAFNIRTAAAACPLIKRLAFLVVNPVELDAALFCFDTMRNLRGLELEIKGMMLSTEQLRVVGMLPLRELALDSHAYRQQPSMPRPQFSHLDNEGVKGLVDSICHRMRSEMMPLKLSLCGATALKQEAVSALLRLPMLTAIDTGGCIKLTPMDRMRLVAKVKAGQGMLDSKNGNAGGNGALAALRVPHAHLL